ncbi:MAG: hypothetical protein ACYDEW_05705 [Vulcanimicrobiaceae bacterium]
MLDMHPAQQATVLISGAVGPLTATLDRRIVTIAIDQAAQTIFVTAEGQTGRATLDVTDTTGASVEIPVRVAFDAGTVPQRLALNVTGSPLDPLWLETQIANLVAEKTRVQPGLSMKLGSFGPPPAVTPGTSASVAVPVQIPGGAQYYDVSGTANVTVTNLPLAPFAPPLLFYDDDPERIVADGPIFRGQITPGTPVRLYYYHQDGTEPSRLVLVLIADSQDPTQIQVIAASAGPSADVMGVGHAVTRDFLLQEPRNEGVVLDLPQLSAYVLADVPLDAQQAAAGSIDLRIVSGGAVDLEVLAAPPEATGRRLRSELGLALLPGDGHHRTGVFDIAGYGSETIAYTVGGPDATTIYGAKSPPNAFPAERGHDYGGYGVLHTFVFDASNPTAQPVTAYLFEEPLGGVVRSSFLVDGQLEQVGCARVSQRYQIASFTMAPGQNLVSTLLTMTDGGSSYPLEIGMTDTPPLPAVPPIAAPDGCFPKAPSPAPSPSPSPPRF